MGDKLIAFTDNFEDLSTEAGFQFNFFCDLCREGFKTKFIESKTYRKKGLLEGLATVVDIATQVTGKYNIGSGMERGVRDIGERFNRMSPEWQKEHEAAFELAQNEAKSHFHRCPKCKKWVCDEDWNEQEGLCVDDAPREAVEVAKAKAQKKAKDIEAAAEKTQVFKGNIESKQTLCYRCGKPAGSGKFCNNCGASLSLLKCPKCGAQNQVGTGFCGECGAKMK